MKVLVELKVYFFDKDGPTTSFNSPFVKGEFLNSFLKKAV